MVYMEKLLVDLKYFEKIMAARSNFEAESCPVHKIEI